jgi:RNA polymerase sigma-70 factor (ECF subfamily)
MAIPASVAVSGSIAADAAVGMDEGSFRRLYDRTARPLKGYLCRMLGNSSKADDLLQDCYLRFLLAKLPAAMTDEHQKNYLFRIATNLTRDELRRRQAVPLMDAPCDQQLGSEITQKRDMQRFLAELEPRERQLLWLAYVEQFSHQEIAGIVGAKTVSIRPMLWRARARLSEILKAGGFRPDTPDEEAQ